MKNPWREQSNINPKRSHGHRQISNPVFQALMTADLNGAEYKCIFCIIDKTWGFNKKSAPIAISTFCEDASLGERQAKRALASLEGKRIVVRGESKIQNRGSAVKEYLINKHYDTWLVEGDVDKLVDKLLKRCRENQERVTNLVRKG